MISKERLEKLIEQGATIYTSRFKKPDKLKLYKDFYISEENELVMTAKKYRCNSWTYKTQTII